MRTLLLIALISLGCSGAGDAGTGGGEGGPPVGGELPSPGPGWMERSSARVFISGHSLTDNPLAERIEEIARSLGGDFAYNQQIGLGSPLRVRTKGSDPDAAGWPGYRSGKNRRGRDMDVVEELRRPRTLGPGERYDTLVITERHDILGVIEHEDTAPYLRHFHDRFIEGNAEGRTYFYESWWRIDKAAPEAWIAYEKQALAAWECVASKVNLTLEADGRRDRITTLPVGAALVELVEGALRGDVRGLAGSTTARLDAIFHDHVHLTPLGVYYAALVVYAGVYGRSAVGASAPDGVSRETAEDLQRIASAYVEAYYSTPSPGARTMESCRELITNDLCEAFWTIRGEPQRIERCRRTFGDPNAPGNPFRWPDDQLRPLPPPD